MREKEKFLPTSLKNYLTNLELKFFGILLVLLSFWLFLSLLSYNSVDPSINTGSTFHLKNIGGIYGANISNILLYFLGLGSFFIIYDIFLIGKYFISKTSLNNPIKKILIYLIISIIPTTLSLSYISNICLKTFPTKTGLGGLLGLTIKTDINSMLTSMGISGYMHIIIFIISTLLSLITLYFALDFTIKSLIRFENFIRYCIATLKNTYLFLTTKKTNKIVIKPQKSKLVSIAKKITSTPPKKEVEKTQQKTSTIQPKIEEKKYIFPSIELLNKSSGNKTNTNTESNIKKARMLENILREYHLDGKITDIKTGPVITLFEMEPGPGIKTSQIKNLSEDIARKLEAISARIAVIPGTNKIGIELPNLHRMNVNLREQFESDTFKHTEHKLPISLGVDIGGSPVFIDLATTPHLLVAGSTGSGKSVGVNSMILSLLYKLRPDECKFIMIDPKVVEFSAYKDIPHLLIPVVTEVAKAVAALKWAVCEMEERYKNMAAMGSKNIESFNQKAKLKQGQFLTRQVQTGFDPETGEPITEERKIEIKPMPYIVIVVDEMADLMQQRKERQEVESAVARLAAMARATGIHLILTTQRPSVDVITGTIKSNFPTRISYRVPSGQDSRTILNENGAELMLGKGDMLYMGTGGHTIRIHGAFVSESEIENVVSFIKTQAEPNYIKTITIEKPTSENAMSSIDKASLKESKDNDLYSQAVEIVLTSQKTSISYLQRRLGIGYNKSANLIEKMEEQGILSEPDSTGKRSLLVKK